MKIGIIGGGAAGFFASVTAKENYPDARVTIFEKSNEVLSKVRLSGGGRCNLTNACDSVSALVKAYPRGGPRLKKIFHVFSNADTLQWFESRGVPLVTEDDLRVFPKSHNAQSVVACLVREAERMGVSVKLNACITRIIRDNEKFALEFDKQGVASVLYDKIIVTTGGSPKRSGLAWLEDLGHKIEDPVPSLFTFNMPDSRVTSLMGLVAENTIVSIQGTKLSAGGPVLITHWGMSGPAILKLSSFGARTLKEMGYTFTLQINWVNEKNNDIVLSALQDITERHPAKLLSNHKPYALPGRLWLYLLEKSGLPEDKPWVEIGKKGMNKLMTVLTNDAYPVRGKTTFRDEFVTCGGVSLDSVDMNTMQSKVCKNLYFAGEILDIDAITGGYNLQCAWTTGFIAGKLQ